VCVEPGLLFAIGQDDNRSLMGLSNQFRQLSLGFSNGQCFHVDSLSQSVRMSKPKRSRGWIAMVQPLFRFGDLRRLQTPVLGFTPAQARAKGVQKIVFTSR